VISAKKGEAAMISLETMLNEAEKALFAGLKTPVQIQAFLDSIPYIAEERNRCPLDVLRDGQCHCYDGALLAAAALRRAGFQPLLINLWPEPGTDDDHILALYRVGRYWGAVAKSNYVSLRAREPVYRSLRELVLTYFEGYFNLEGLKTLRRYSSVLDLTRFDGLNWETDESAVQVIEQRLHHLRTYSLFTPEMIGGLSPVDQRTYQALMTWTDVNEAFGRRPAH